MATRSAIGIRLNNDKIKAVYCHYDGYPEGVGKTLLEHYDGKTNATKLISLGDISVLDKSMSKPAGHTFNKPVNGYSVFYGRDRGEKNTKAKIYDSVKDIFNKLGSEYVYVLENNQWMYASEDNQKLRPLIDNMATGGVVEEIKTKYQIAGSDKNGVYTYSKSVAEEIAKKYNGDVQEDGSKWYVRLEEQYATGGGVGRNVSKYEVEKLSNLAYQLQNVEDSWIAKNHSKFVEMQNEYKKQFKKVYGHSNYENPDDFGKMATGGGVEGYYFEVEKEGDNYSVYFYKPSGDLDWGKQGFSTQQEAQMYGEENIEKYKTKYPKPNFNYENPAYFDDSNFNYDNWASTDKMATGGEISAVEDWVGMDYSKEQIEMVLDALEKADISFPEDTKVENASSIEDETRQTAEMTDDFYNEIEEYCPTLDEKALKEILWGVIHASKNYKTSGSPVTYSNFDMMEGSSNTQDLEVFETKLRILTTNWLNEGFEKEEVLEYIEHLLDQI